MYIKSKTNYRQALEENTLMQESKPTYEQTKMRDNKKCITEHLDINNNNNNNNNKLFYI
jgi:hypothetical protein